jgi:hypothetical protein
LLLGGEITVRQPVPSALLHQVNLVEHGWIVGEEYSLSLPAGHFLDRVSFPGWITVNNMQPPATEFDSIRGIFGPRFSKWISTEE